MTEDRFTQYATQADSLEEALSWLVSKYDSEYGDADGVSMTIQEVLMLGDDVVPGSRKWFVSITGKVTLTK